MPFRFRIKVDAKPDDVWATIADIPRHGEWANPKATLSVEPVGSDELAPGSQFRSTQRFAGKETGARLRVTAVEPPRRLSFEAVQKMGKREITYSHTFTLTPADGGTIVERAIDSNGPKIGVIFYPAIRADAMKALRGLKRTVEGGPR